MFRVQEVGFGFPGRGYVLQRLNRCLGWQGCQCVANIPTIDFEMVDHKLQQRPASHFPPLRSWLVACVLVSAILARHGIPFRLPRRSRRPPVRCVAAGIGGRCYDCHGICSGGLRLGKAQRMPDLFARGCVWPNKGCQDGRCGAPATANEPQVQDRAGPNLRGFPALRWLRQERQRPPLRLYSHCQRHDRFGHELPAGPLRARGVSGSVSARQAFGCLGI